MFAVLAVVRPTVAVGACDGWPQSGGLPATTGVDYKDASSGSAVWSNGDIKVQIATSYTCNAWLRTWTYNALFTTSADKNYWKRMMTVAGGSTNCNYAGSGTTDYMRADGCGTGSFPANTAGLVQNTTYSNWGIGFASCSTDYGANVGWTVNRFPGANCGTPAYISPVASSPKLDWTSPTTPAVTITPGANAYVSGTTVYVRSSVSSSFTATASGSIDSGGSGLSTYNWTLTGSTAGWTPLTSSSSSQAFSWTTFVTDGQTATLSATASDVAGNTSSSTARTLIGDETAPVATYIFPTTQSYKTTTADFAVTWNETESGSGVGSRTGQWQSASLTDGVCGAWADTGSPFAASWGIATRTPVSDDLCYRLVLTIADNVGNGATYASAAVVIDTTAPVAPTVSNNEASLSGAYATGPTATSIWFRPSAAQTITLTSDGTDAHSGIASSTFGALTSATGWTYTSGTVAGDPAAKSLTWSASSTSATSLSITTSNNAGLASPATTVTFTPDTAAPTASFTAPPNGVSSQSGTTISPTWSELDTKDGSNPGAGVGTHSLQRQVSTTTAGACDNAWSNDGTPYTGTSPAPSQTLVNGRCYRWLQTLTDNVGNQAVSTSGTLLVGSVPTVVVTDNTASLANAYRSTNTVFFASTAGGTVQLTATGSDPGSSIISNTFGALTGTPTGWSPTTQQTDSVNPYALTYTWSAASPSTSTSVTTRNALSVDSAPVVITFTPDDAAPVISFVAPPGGGPAMQPGTAYTVTFNATDAGSGFGETGAGWSLQRQITIAANGTCGGFANDTAAGNLVTGQTNVTNQTSAQTLATGNCYRWLLGATDSVGLAASAVTSGSILIDATAPAAPAVTDNAPSGSYRTGDTIYFRPSAASTITLTSIGSDAESGVASSTFGSLSPSTGWTYVAGTVAGNPAPKSLTWSASAVSASLPVTTTNGAGGISGATIISFVADATAPSISSLLPAAGTSSQSATTVTVSWAETESGSGVGSRALQRQLAAATAWTECASATYANDGPAQDVASPKSETNLSGNTCYRWMLTVTDRVGNASPTSTSGMVFIETTGPPAPSAPDLDTTSDSAPVVKLDLSTTIRPAADVAKAGLADYSSGNEIWLNIDEPVLGSDYYLPYNGGYAGLGGAGAWGIVSFTSSGLAPTTPVRSVTFTFDFAGNSAPAGDSFVYVVNPATGTPYLLFHCGQNPASYHLVTTWATRPWDGQSWTVADVNALQVEFQATYLPVGSFYVHRLAADVNYTNFGPDPARTTDNVTSDTTPSLSGTNDPSATRVDVYDGPTLVGTDDTVAGGTWSLTTSSLGDGVHSLTAKATSAGGTSSPSPSLSATIDTTAPAAPSAPDMSAASDTGVSSSDNITTSRQPTFTGTGSPDTASVILLDGATLVDGDNAPGAGTTYSVAPIVILAPGVRNVSVMAYDLAGNSTPSAGLSTTIVAYLNAIRVDAVPSTPVASTTMVVATLVNEIGQPLADYAGTLTISSDDPAAKYPDGTSFAISSNSGVSGHAFRVRFGTPGSRLITISAGSTVTGTRPVTVTAASIDLTAPATVYQGIPFQLDYSPKASGGVPATAYGGRATFSSSDSTVSFGSPIDGAQQYQFTCGCDATKHFHLSLSTLGTQTITVVDDFGLTDQVSVNVVAPSSAPSPVQAVQAVQWTHGNVVDYYVQIAPGVASLRFIEASDYCGAGGGIVSSESINEEFTSADTGSTGYFEFSVELNNASQPTSCWISDASPDIHSLTFTDGTHTWGTVHFGSFSLFSDLAGGSNYTMLDPGNPIVGLSTQRSPSWTYYPNGSGQDFPLSQATMTATTREPIRVWGVGWRGGGSDPNFLSPPSQRFPLAGTSTVVTVEDVPYKCNIVGDPGLTDTLRLIYSNANGRAGRTEWYVGPAPISPTNQDCAWPHNGTSFGTNSDPHRLGMSLESASGSLFDAIGAALRADPVDSYRGAYVDRATDFALGGLTPSLHMQRTYRSDIADNQATADLGLIVAPHLFGPGWASPYDEVLVLPGAGADPNLITQRTADGGQRTWQRDGAGTWKASDQSSDALVAIAGGWKVVDLGGAGSRFDANGRVVAVFDAFGRELVLTYDGSDHLASLTDAASRTATVTTDGSGRITRIDLPDGRHTDYTYVNGFLATETDLSGRVTSYVTDTRGRIRTVSADGAVRLTNVYDELGRVIAQTDARGYTTYFAYDPLDNVTQVIGPRGDVTTDCFTEYGATLASVDALGGTRHWTYNATGDIVAATDELGRRSKATYDSRHLLTRATDAVGHAATFTYDAKGHVTTMVDAAGGTTTNVFDPATGLPTTVTISDATHSKLVASYGYDPTTHLLTSATDQGGAVTTTHYDSRGYVDYTIDPRGGKTTFTTDARGFVNSIVDALGNAVGGVPSEHTTAMTYDAMGRVLTRTNALNQTTTYDYDAAGRLESETSPLGKVTSYTYDAAGNVATMTETLTAGVTATTTYERDAAGNVTAVVDAESRRIETTYDLVGRVTAVRDANGKVWTTEYDLRGRVTKTLDPTGRFSTTGYDALDRVVSQTDPAGLTRTFAFDAAGLLASTTEPGNRTTSFGYDWLGRQTSVTNANDETWSIAFNADGEVQSSTNARNKTTSYTYDAGHLLLTVIEPGAFDTTFTYDAAGRLETRTNDRTATETYAYDALNRPIRLTDPLGNFWRTFYDADGRVDYTIDANGQTTDFGYDLAGRLLTITPATGPAITYTYDKTDRRLTMSDPSGLTTYGTDPVGRLTSLAHAGRTTGYTYDDAGRPTAITLPGGAGSVGYGYDTAGRLQTITDWASRVTSFTYDSLGRQATTTQPGGLVTTYGYDDLDRPTSLTSVRNAVTLLSLGYTYDPNGNVATFTTDLGTATFGYDDLDRLTSAAYPGALNYAYGYDAVGNVTSVTKPSGATTYTYDLADRITSTGPAGSPVPGSSAGAPSTNDAGWTNAANATASDNTYATASPAKNQTTSVRYGTFGFDAQIPANATITNVTVSVEWKVDTTSSIATLGSQVYVGGVARGTELVNSAEPTSDTTQTYSVSGLTRADLLDGTFQVQVRASRGNSNNAFNASLDAVSVTVDYTVPGAASAPTYDPNGNMLTDGSYGNRTYSYDALGRLTGVSGNGTTATYVLDGDGNRWSETLNAVATSFDLDLSVANPTVLFDGTRRYLPGNPVAGYEQAGTWWSALADQTGSPITFVSQTGTTTTPVHYDPYGGPLSGSADPTGIGYAGEWKNATGLINLRARSYDPAVGRFVGRDTLGGVLLQPQTANRYAYANLNPLRYGDPSGHFGRAWNSWGRSAFEFAVTWNPAGYAVTSAWELLTGTNPFTGAQIDRGEKLKELAIVVATVGVARVVHAALPLIRGVADDVARLESRVAASGSRASAEGRALVVHPFSVGASHITTTARLRAHPTSITIGSPAGLFVSPTNELDELLAKASSRTEIEAALGLEQGVLREGELVRFDIPDPFAFGLRLADPALGNVHHLPGSARTIGGVSEAVITTPLISDIGTRVIKTVLRGFPW